MQIDFFNPSNDLKILVKDYKIILNNKENIRDKFIPRFDASLVFNFSKTVVAFENDKKFDLPSFFIAPVLSKPLSILVENNTTTMVITCKASVLSRVLKIDFSAKKQAPYVEVSNPLISQLFELLKEEKISLKKVILFEKYFTDHFAISLYTPDEVDKMYGNIVENSFYKDVYKNFEEIKVHDRSIRRYFKTRIGVSPKFLVRLVRLHLLWEKYEKDEDCDFLDLVHELGYFDQAHMIKDFKSVFNELPSIFFQRNKKDLKIISGTDF